MLLPAQRRTAKLALSRLGTRCTISEPVPGGTDDYGKPIESGWSAVGAEYVARTYTRGSAPRQSQVDGGRYRSDSPFLLFSYDSVVEEGFRVAYGEPPADGTEDNRPIYEIDSVATYPTHFEATTTVVSI